MTKQIFAILEQVPHVRTASGEIVKRSSKDFWVPEILKHITEPVDVSVVDCNLNEIERFEVRPEVK